MLQSVCLLVLFAAGTVAQVRQPGFCPNVPLQPNFNLNRYFGKWYEMARFFAIFELGQTCVTATYTPRGDGSVTVNNQGYNRRRGTYIGGIGNAIPTDPTNPAKLGVSFGPGMPRGNYWVVETDYDNYSVVWSCRQTRSWPPVNQQFAWILTRHPLGLWSGNTMEILQRLQYYGINTSHFTFTDQVNCP